MIDIQACLAQSGARVMVVAPHPDDESLATGGLLQCAHAAGAATKVVLVTDGDNNPWPQRWLERRLRIDAEARKRWGQRRRGEARAAMTALGLPADVAKCLGWPDLGVNAYLMTDTAYAVRTLAEAIDAFAPSLLVFPSLGDSHPDHSACHVLVQLALAQRAAAEQPVLASYLVHGSVPAGEAWRLPLPPAIVAGKRAAVLTYQTQVTLSRKRLLTSVGDTELYYPEPAAAAARGTTTWAASPLLSQLCELLVVGGEQTWRLPWKDLRSAPNLLDAVIASAPQPVANDAPVFAKLRTRQRSPWIFDRWGWRCLRVGAAQA